MAAAALGLFLAIGAGAAFASTNNAMYIGEAKVELSLDLLNVEGWTYVPVREFADRMGWRISYDKESHLISIGNAIGDTLSFKSESSQITYNGTHYNISESVVIEDGNAYFPLRQLAEAMHAHVGWRNDEKLAEIETVQAYVVADGDTLWNIAQDHETTVEALQLRNGMADEPLQVGQRLKVVVPSFMLENRPETAMSDPEASVADEIENEADSSDAAVEVDPDDLALLAKLIQVEAGNEPYEGKLAVASVVMNRVRSEEFPDTVKDVIYAPHQFPPATNGLLDKAKASEDCVKAAKAALSGENNVPGAVYFFNAKREPGKLKLVDVVKVIGNHTFAK